MLGNSAARRHGTTNQNNNAKNRRRIITYSFYSTDRRVTVKFRVRFQLDQKAQSWKKALSTIVSLYSVQVRQVTLPPSMPPAPISTRCWLPVWLKADN